MAARESRLNMGMNLLLICAFLIVSSVTLAGWKGDGLYRGQVKSLEERFPSQGGRVVMVARTFFDREARQVKIEHWTEFGGIPRGNTVFLTTHTQDGITRWSVSQEEGAARPSGILFTRPTGTQGRIEVSVSYRADGEFSQLQLRHFDRCGGVTQDISYLSYSPFVLQKDVSNSYATDCKLANTDTIFRDRNRAVTQYDSQGRPMETTRYDLSGSLIERETFQYNSHDDEVGSTIVSSDGTVETKSMVEYEYDSMGNWVKKTSKVLIRDGRSVEEQAGLITRSFEYFPLSTSPDEKNRDRLNY